MTTRREVAQVIRQVFDPEIPVNICDLGLIYDISVSGGAVQVQMSLTAEGCPAARELPNMVRSRVSLLPHVKQVNVDVVWEPRWNPAMINEEGRRVLKLDE